MPVRPDIEAAVRRAAERMVTDVLALLAEAGPMLEEPSAGPPRRVRRRAQSLERLAAEILGTLSKRDGVSVGAIARALGAGPRELTRPLTWLLARGQVRRTGDRRGARYFLSAPVAAERSAQEAGEARPRRKATASGQRRRRRRPRNEAPKKVAPAKKAAARAGKAGGARGARNGAPKKARKTARTRR